MKKLTIKSLATTGAFLLLLATSFSACGQQGQKSSSGPGATPQQSASSGGDELQRAKARAGVESGSDELQRWENRYPTSGH